MFTDVEQRRRVSVLQTARTLLAARSDVAEVADAAAEVLTEVLGGGCVVRLASPDRVWLDAVAIRSAEPEHQQFIEAVVRSAGRQPADAGLNGAVFWSGQALAMGEIDVEEYRLLLQPEFWPVLDRYRVLSTIAVPLRGETAILGTLTVAHFDTPTSYTNDCQALIEDLANMVASAIDRAHRSRHGEHAGRVQRVTMFCETERERPYLVWRDGHIYCSDWVTREALRRIVPHHKWETAITEPSEALEAFAAAFATMGLTPQVRLA